MSLTRPQASQISYESPDINFTETDVQGALDSLIAKVKMLRETGTVTAGQTVIPTSNTITDTTTVSLYLNGVRQQPNIYNATSNAVTLVAPAEYAFSYLIELSSSVTNIALSPSE